MHRLWRAIWPAVSAAAAAALLALVLAACGPGVGGSGTGTGAAVGSLDDFGAVAASVCDAPFASRLDCPPAAGASAPSTPAPGGTAPTVWVDVVTGGQTQLRFEGNRAELDAHCQRLQFDGEWGVTPAGAARYFGSTLAPGALQRQPAVLEVGLGPGAELRVTLRDAGGAVLLGPAALRGALPTDPAPAACPP